MARHGENIRKRKDGRWEARYIHHYQMNKAVYRSVYGKTYQEAKEKRNQMMKQQGRGRFERSAPSRFHEASENWLKSKNNAVKESTFCRYQQIIRCHLNPALGEVPCGQITKNMVVEVLLSLHDQEKKLAPKTIMDIKSVLVMILKTCTNIDLSNLQKDHLPKTKGKISARKVLTKEDQRKLESYLVESNNPRIAMAIQISLYTGLRIGEICGLKWEDIKADAGTINIMRTVIRLPNGNATDEKKTKLTVQTPKSICSCRIIPIPDDLWKVLEKHRKADSCYVLTGTEHYLEPRTLQKQYKGLIKKIGIPDNTFHTLRHTFATRCVESGMDIKSLSEIMGHANVSTTMQMYVHPSMDTKRNQMNKMEQWLMHEES